MHSVQGSQEQRVQAAVNGVEKEKLGCPILCIAGKMLRFAMLVCFVLLAWGMQISHDA